MLQSPQFDSICKPNRHRIGRLIERSVGVRHADLAGRKPAAKDRGKHAVEFRFRHLLGRERAQVVILVRNDLRARADGRHLAVADVGQPGALGDLTDFGNLRQIQRVIGRIAGHDCERQRHAQRIKHRHGDFDLRQIGAMILAVPELEQPCGRHVGRCRRGVDAHQPSLQVVDAHHGLIECTFKHGPTFSDAEVIQDRRQPIIGQVTRSDRAVDASPEGPQMFLDPWLNAIEPVVALREDESQPHHGRLAETQALPIAIGEEVVVQ